MARIFSPALLFFILLCTLHVYRPYKSLSLERPHLTTQMAEPHSTNTIKMVNNKQVLIFPPCIAIEHVVDIYSRHSAFPLGYLKTLSRKHPRELETLDGNHRVLKPVARLSTETSTSILLIKCLQRFHKHTITCLLAPVSIDNSMLLGNYRFVTRISSTLDHLMG